MTGQAHWLDLLLILGFVVAVVAYLAGTGRLLKRYRAVRRDFLCPRTGTEAHGAMVNDAVTREWTGVTECSARNPGQPCSLGCVALANGKPAATPSAT